MGLIDTCKKTYASLIIFLIIIAQLSLTEVQIILL